MRHQLGGKKSRKQRGAAQNPQMGKDLFSYLPSEMIINILSRLPARTAIRCKCVCKLWLNLLATPEFVKSHLSKAVPGLGIFEWETHTKPYKIVEFVDKLDLNIDEHRWNVVFSFHLPFYEPVHSSANGLLLLCDHGYYPSDLILCNPVTREYIKFPCPRESYSKFQVPLENFGLGVSRMSEQVKVVRIFYGMLGIFVSDKLFESECQVYSVGTGSWRRIASAGLLNYEYEDGTGAFLNGNLHWLAHARARDLNGSAALISCFDLETELFSTFSPPPLPLPPRDSSHRSRKLSVLGDCLCLCSTDGYYTHMWLMMEYGDEKSWTKEFVIRKMFHADFLGFLSPIKVFEDGDILMAMEMRWLLYYSNKTKTIREVDASGSDCTGRTTAISYTPSFVSQNYCNGECSLILISGYR